MADQYGRDPIGSVGLFTNNNNWKGLVKNERQQDHELLELLARTILRNLENPEFGMEFVIFESKFGKDGRGPTHNMKLQVVKADMGEGAPPKQERPRQEPQQRQQPAQRPAPQREEAPLPDNDDELPF